MAEKTSQKTDINSVTCAFVGLLEMKSEALNEIKSGREEITGYHDGPGGLGKHRQNEDIKNYEKNIDQLQKGLTSTESFHKAVSSKFKNTSFELNAQNIEKQLAQNISTNKETVEFKMKM